MKRPGFLTVFFVALGIVFAAILFVRIRSYQIADEIELPSMKTDSSGEETGDRRAESIATADDSSSRRAPATKKPSEQFDAVPLLEPSGRTLVAQPSASAPPPIARQARGATPTAPGGRETAPPPTKALGATRTGSAPKPSSAPQVSSAPQPPSTDKPPDAPPVEEKNDPTSDSTAPQLIAISFTPAQIADGEETLLLVQATDDLSGIRSISGTIIAPSGAVQGFACQREGDTNRFVARIVVPKDAAEGAWSVNYLNLMDNASNSAAVTAGRGGMPPSASFRVVSSRPDSQGPSLQAVWLDRRSMRGGEKNMVFVRAEDDKSGVNLVSGIFQSPSRQARVGFVCRTTGDGLWTCEMTAPACADCGEWQLEQVQMQDKANNMTTLRASQSQLVAAVRVDIASDLCDATPPALQSIALDRPVVSNVEQSMIGITVSLTDDACGVLSVSGQATGPPPATGTPPRLYFSFSPGADPSHWVGKLIVPRLAAKGVWRISFLQVLDRGQNLKTYTQNDPLLAGVTFVVD